MYVLNTDKYSQYVPLSNLFEILKSTLKQEIFLPKKSSSRNLTQNKTQKTVCQHHFPRNPALAWLNLSVQSWCLLRGDNWRSSLEARVARVIRVHLLRYLGNLD